MLTVVYREIAASISDFEAYQFVDKCIETYKIEKEINPSYDMGIQVSNSIVIDIFGLRALENKISIDDIEFYADKEKLEFDEYFGLMDPNNKLGIYADVSDKALAILYKNCMERGKKLKK